jgi:NOL1/NOP2/sun family putative RNA methylase
MTEKLPGAFVAKMKRLLREEAEAFLASYKAERTYGLRVNTLKLEPSAFAAIAPFQLTPVPWCPSGFYYHADDRPGKHPFHAAGLYYIQEPSAMAVVECLGIRPGDKVLDLAAAPGGKATQAGQALRGEGLLVANEIHPTRAKILSENIERMGIRSAVVTNEPPGSLARRFPSFFDKLIVDAPCSGEGMFRKDETARLEWSEENVGRCTRRQDEVLKAAAEMVKPGGRLVYSTCTFSPEENEQIIARFLNRHSDFTLMPIPIAGCFSPGQPEWAEGDGGWPFELCCRLWPHRLQGEGHFIALLARKTDEVEYASPRHNERLGRLDRGRRSKKDRDVEDAWQLFRAFSADFLNIDVDGLKEAGQPLLFGEQLYIQPVPAPDLQGLKVLRPGWHLGAVKKGRFEPSHALALSLKADEVKQTLELAGGLHMVDAYLHGETLPIDIKKGWVLVTVDSYPLGWGKASGGQLKNHYPKGLRVP